MQAQIGQLLLLIVQLRRTIVLLLEHFVHSLMQWLPFPFHYELFLIALARGRRLVNLAAFVYV